MSRGGRRRSAALWLASLLASLLVLGLGGCAFAVVHAIRSAQGTPSFDPVSRIAVMTAFDAELGLLKAAVQSPRTQRLHGIEFTTGTLAGRDVVLFMSGMSMTNAAQSTQLALDRYKVSHIVFSGIAGGVDPALHVGDVSVPERWSSYLEAVYARETAPGRYAPPAWMKNTVLPGFGMAFPRPVGVRSDRGTAVEERQWFEVDAGMLAAARRLAGAGTLSFERCAAPGRCLADAPRLSIGGNGVSGQAFVDNAAFRDYTFTTFGARLLDMETAAVAQVAYTNGVPFLAFRSLSDLAGGGSGENEVETFFRIAADNSARVVLAFLAAWRP